MSDSFENLAKGLPLQGMLGYLNFSSGKPDTTFQKQLDYSYGLLANAGVEKPWELLPQILKTKLHELEDSGTSAFQDVAQAEAMLAQLFPGTLRAYRNYHADLLYDLSERQLFQPFFLARVFEAILTQGLPWTEGDRVVNGALNQLNDFVGYRPIAILETRPRAEPYPHEKCRPIPLYIQGTGVASGPYHDVVSRALEILRATDHGILDEACFDPDMVEELAVDPRSYDQSHPIDSRPGYIFGEWDPHHLDQEGRYRRFILRRLTLDALLDRVKVADGQAREETLIEAASVLAGTILMASGICGNAPTTHDSTMTLGKLLPRVARCRDLFYSTWLGKIKGTHGDRLRQEAAVTQQPFGKARQHLNEYRAQHRARQLQQRHVAVLFAEMGQAAASREEAIKVPSTFGRILSEIAIRLHEGHRAKELEKLEITEQKLSEAEDWLRRGIDCGALADPWNILGFHGTFPIGSAQEDGVRDSRIDNLVYVQTQIFDLYSQAASQASARGDRKLSTALLARLARLAIWWDQFASTAIEDVARVHGGEVVDSAQRAAHTLDRWHGRDETSDLGFWKQEIHEFHSPKTFALVAEAILRKGDYRAAMALLVSWAGRGEQVPLEDGVYSFHMLAIRWMLEAGTSEGANREGSKIVGSAADVSLLKKFFDYLEANAEDYWEVPSLESEDTSSDERDDDREEELYSAAYEGVSYQDSADDENEGAVFEGDQSSPGFDLEIEAPILTNRLRFLITLARVWHLAARRIAGTPNGQAEAAEALEGWLRRARHNQSRLVNLMEEVHRYPIPGASGSYESLVEFDRRRVLKEQLLEAVITASLETSLAFGALRGSCESAGISIANDPEEKRELVPGWEAAALQLQDALWSGDSETARRLMPEFLEHFKNEPLLLVAPGKGEPRYIVRVRLALSVARALLANLPRLGLFAETLRLLETARSMEQAAPPGGQGISEFITLFDAAYQAVIQNTIASSVIWNPTENDDQKLVQLLNELAEPFLKIWINHSQGLRLAALEPMAPPDQWNRIEAFIKQYGGDLFQAKFMTLGNLRGILHRGTGAYLDYLRENPNPLEPIQLIEDLGDKISKEEASRMVDMVLRVIVENYDEYRDYNTSTGHSDYGQNLFRLLDLLRLKASYERNAWQLRPLLAAHEMLAQNGRLQAAVLWEETLSGITKPCSERHLEELQKLEKDHGMRLRTVRDRLEEGFLKPLGMNQICALVRPAMEEATGSPTSPSFTRLRDALEPFLASPTGAGLEVPSWLQRLENEVHRLWAKQNAVAMKAEALFEVPQARLSLSQIQDQIKECNHSPPSH